MKDEAIFFESFTQQSKLKVDRTNRLIKGVKLVGLVSLDNKRRYSKQVLKDAIPRYEGKPVYTNHPLDPSTGQPNGKRSRTVEEKLGAVVNVRLTDDGLYGDVRYLSKHPMTERLLEAAEDFPEAFGMSHAVSLQGKYAKDGFYDVESIPVVRSVDLVCEPGTVKGLHESRSNMLTLKVFFESLIPKFHKTKHRLLKSVFEEDMMPADTPMDVAPVDATTDPDEALKQGFRAAALAVIDDDSMGAAEKLKKLKELLTTQEKLASGGASEPAPESDDSDSKDTESRLMTAVAICHEASISPSPVLIKSLVALETDEERRQLVAQQKAAFESTRPQSRGPGVKKPEPTPATGGAPKDAKDYASRFKGK